jgi:hypothetical protein
MAGGMLCAGCQATLRSNTLVARPPVAVQTVKIYDGMPTNAVIVGTMQVSCMSGFTHYFIRPEKKQMLAAAAFMGANGLVIGPGSVQILVGYAVSATAIFVP